MPIQHHTTATSLLPLYQNEAGSAAVKNHRGRPKLYQLKLRSVRQQKEAARSYPRCVLRRPVTPLVRVPTHPHVTRHRCDTSPRSVLVLNTCGESTVAEEFH